MTRADLTAVLRRLDDTALAALLHELGFELYRREIARWRVLSDLADELMDRATFEARVKVSRVFTAPRRRLRSRPGRRFRRSA